MEVEDPGFGESALGVGAEWMGLRDLKFYADVSERTVRSRLLFLFVPTAGMDESGKLLRIMAPRDGVEPLPPAFSGLVKAANQNYIQMMVRVMFGTPTYRLRIPSCS